MAEAEDLRMTWLKPPSPRREEGAILIIALAFLIFAGGLAAALLTLGGPSLLTTSVVRDVQSGVTAADAGINYAIQTLRDPANQSNPTQCASPGTSSILGWSGVPSIDGLAGYSLASAQPKGTIEVTCLTEQGYAAGTFGWATITNDPGADSMSDQGGQPKSITGPVYDSGGWSLKDVMDVNFGNVYTAGTGCPYPDQTSKLTVAPSPPFSQSCVSASAMPTPVVPAVLPPLSGPYALPLAKNTSSFVTTNACGTLLEPGIYEAPYFTSADLQGFLDGNVYLNSGDYYFDDVGALTVKGSLFGGQPSAGEAQDTTTANPCATSDSPGGNGTGVEIILGRSSTLTVSNSGTMELYTRTPSMCVGKPCDGSTPGISLYQIPSAPFTAPSPTCTSAAQPSPCWDPTNIASDIDFLSVGNGDKVASYVHGAIYGPAGSVFLFATNSSIAAVGGGMDVWDLAMKSSASATGLLDSIAVTTGQRTTVLTSTAILPSGRTFTTRAVVTINNDIYRTVTIESWRTQQ